MTVSIPGCWEAPAFPGLTRSDATLIWKAVHDKTGLPLEEITFESSFIDDLGCDSLDIVELIMAFEDNLGIDIPDEDVAGLPTVKAVCAYVAARRASAPKS